MPQYRTRWTRWTRWTRRSSQSKKIRWTRLDRTAKQARQTGQTSQSEWECRSDLGKHWYSVNCFANQRLILKQIRFSTMGKFNFLHKKASQCGHGQLVSGIFSIFLPQPLSIVSLVNECHLSASFWIGNLQTSPRKVGMSTFCRKHSNMVYLGSRNSGNLDSNLKKIMLRYLWIIKKIDTFF